MRKRNHPGPFREHEILPLIQPVLSEAEAMQVMELVQDHINGRESVIGWFRKITNSRSYRDRKTVKKITLAKFHRTIKQSWDEFPPSVVHDIYNLYMHPIEALCMDAIEKKHRAQYAFLKRSNIPPLKILTEGSLLKSSIVTSRIILFYLIQIAKLKLLNAAEDGSVPPTIFFNGTGNDFEGIDLYYEKFNTPSDRKWFDSMIAEAKLACGKVDQLLAQATAESLGKTLSCGKQGSNRISKLSNLLSKLEHMEMAGAELKEWVKKLLERSQNHFHPRSDSEYDRWIDMDHPKLPNELHLFHPSCRAFYLDDLLANKDSSQRSIDLYIDISGSMSSTIIKQANGIQLTLLDLAKAIALELIEQRTIHKLYLFNAALHACEPNQEQLASIIAMGGTNLNLVLKQIEHEEKNAIIITDAKDRCSIYSTYAYFIGMKGADFRHFEKEVIRQYSENEQAILFDGNQIIQVDTSGKCLIDFEKTVVINKIT